MRNFIDYIHWTDDEILEKGIEKILDESLSFVSRDKFIKQMKTIFKDFERYTTTIKGNEIWLSCLIMDKISYAELKKYIETFSYRIADTKNNQFILKPEHETQKISDRIFIHISKNTDLALMGLRCKASHKFEDYEPRIYLYPLSSLAKEKYDGMDMSKISKIVKDKCIEIKNRFNEIYNENAEYQMYVVKLPKQFITYKDPSQSRNFAIYIENNIPAKYITWLGTI